MTYVNRLSQLKRAFVIYDFPKTDYRVPCVLLLLVAPQATHRVLTGFKAPSLHLKSLQSLQCSFSLSSLSPPVS